MDTLDERLIISHSSALELYRLLRGAAGWAPRVVPCLADAQELLDQLTAPIHMLRERSAHGKSRKQLIIHACSEPLEGANVREVVPGVRVVSPELCLLELARAQVPALIVALAMEFCGTYACRATGGAVVPGESTRYGLPPLTSVSRIESFLQNNPGRSGANRVRRILPYVLDGSASPAETILYELISLPTRWGGAGLETGRANYRVDIRGTSDLARQNQVVFDLYWPERNVVVEYDGKRYHEGDRHIERDAARRNAVVALGTTMFTITKAQLRDIEYIDNLCNTLSQCLRGRPLCIQTENYVDKRAQLHRMLLEI